MPQGRLLCGFCLPTEGGAPDTPHNVSRIVSVNPKSNKSCRIVCTVGHDVCNVVCLSASSSKEGDHNCWHPTRTRKLGHRGAGKRPEVGFVFRVKVGMPARRLGTYLVVLYSNLD